MKKGLMSRLSKGFFRDLVIWVCFIAMSVPFTPAIVAQEMVALSKAKKAEDQKYAEYRKQRVDPRLSVSLGRLEGTAEIARGLQSENAQLCAVAIERLDILKYSNDELEKKCEELSKGDEKIRVILCGITQQLVCVAQMLECAKRDIAEINCKIDSINCSLQALGQYLCVIRGNVIRAMIRSFLVGFIMGMGLSFGLGGISGGGAGGIGAIASVGIF